MTGCCAVGCSNRPKKGFKMHKLPSDRAMKEKWLTKTSRRDPTNKNKPWVPPKHVKLCEAHFTEDQYESSGQDGIKKLKWNAVPTLFSHQPKKSKAQPKSRPKGKWQLAVEGPSKGTDEGPSAIERPPELLDHVYSLPLSFAETEKSSYEVPVEEMQEEFGCQAGDVQQRTEDGPVDRICCPALHEEIAKLRRELRASQDECRKLKTQQVRSAQHLDKLLNRDQLQALRRNGSMQGATWSSGTVKKAIKIRIACGTSGYLYLLSTGFPLPGERTLQRRVEDISFEPGILESVFQFLKLKVDQMSDAEKLCCLTLDEMSLKAKVDIDPTHGQVIGGVTLPNHSGLANHALVFMLGGLTTRWKQTVAYHFTGQGMNGVELKDIALQVIHKASAIGLHVAAVASDMGSANRAMWKSFGIYATAKKIKNSVPHPVKESAKLYFLADVPHLLKNIKQAFISGHRFKIDADIVEKEGLSYDIASVDPVKDLASFQEGLQLKIAPQLCSSLLKPSHFNKMRVPHATKVISRSVVAGLEYLVRKEGRPTSNLTTAWLINLVARWFGLMTSRSPTLALSKFKEDSYVEATTLLRSVMQLFNTIKIGNGTWKPCQSGVLLSTQTVLDLTEELLAGGQKFVLTGRLTQDCLENLFSVVRSRKAVPSPLEFKRTLKAITISQFLHTAKEGSYEEDDGHLVAEFLQPVQQTVASQAAPEEDDENLPPEVESMLEMEELPDSECSSLYYMAGYCLHAVTCNQEICYPCFASLLSTSADTPHPASVLTDLKNFTPGSLLKVNSDAFDMFLSMETKFRQLEDPILAGALSSSAVRRHLLSSVEKTSLPECHAIKEKLVTKFARSRLHFLCKSKNAELRKNKKTMVGCMGSKTMAMHKLADDVK